MLKSAQSQEERAALLGYISRRIGVTPQTLVGNMPFEVAVALRAGEPRGALLYTNFRGHSIELSVAGEPGWLSRAVIQAAFVYPFVQLGCWTVLSMTSRGNDASRTLARRIGFQEMCVIETGGRRADDIILYAMTRNKCHWLPAADQIRKVA